MECAVRVCMTPLDWHRKLNETRLGLDKSEVSSKGAGLKAQPIPNIGHGRIIPLPYCHNHVTIVISNCFAPSFSLFSSPTHSGCSGVVINPAGTTLMPKAQTLSDTIEFLKSVG